MPWTDANGITWNDPRAPSGWGIDAGGHPVPPPVGGTPTPPSSGTSPSASTAPQQSSPQGAAPPAVPSGGGGGQQVFIEKNPDGSFTVFIDNNGRVPLGKFQNQQEADTFANGLGGTVVHTWEPTPLPAPAPTPSPALPQGGKQPVYFDGVNLYLQNPDGSYRRITNEAELQQLAQQGVIDPRADRIPLPPGANISAGPTPAPAPTPGPQPTPGGAPAPSGAPTPAAPGATVTVYDKNGNPVQVSADKDIVGIYLGGGYSLSPPGTPGAAATAPPVSGNVILVGPNGQKVSVSPTDPLYQQYLDGGFAPEGGAPAPPGSGADMYDFSNLPENLRNDPRFMALPFEKQVYLVIYYNSLALGNKADQEAAAKALSDAMAFVDVYTKEQIKIVQDDLIQKATGINASAAYKTANLKDRIKALQEDLVFNKEHLTLQQQGELSRQLQVYQRELEQTQEQMVESGLAFSTPRTRAELELRKQQEGIAEATNLQFSKSQRDLEVGTERERLEAEAKIAEEERLRQAAITAAFHAGEAQVGSGNIPTVPGVTTPAPIGGITGSIPQEGTVSGIGLAGAIENQGSPPGVDALLNTSFF